MKHWMSDCTSAFPESPPARGRGLKLTKMLLPARKVAKISGLEGASMVCRRGMGAGVRRCLENEANRRGKRCRREKRPCSVNDYRFMLS